MACYGHRGPAAAARGDEANLLELGHRAVHCPCGYLVAVLQLLDGRQWLAWAKRTACDRVSQVRGDVLVRAPWLGIAGSKSVSRRG